MVAHRMSLLVISLASLTFNTFADTAKDVLPVPGGIYLWRIPNGVSNVRFDGQPVLAIQDVALIGIPLSSTPGSYQLTYQSNGNNLAHAFNVHDKIYTEQHIKIENRAMVTPPEATNARIAQEAGRQRTLYTAYAFETHLADGFIQPVAGPVTSLFGHKRFFNGQARSPHSGLDIAAVTGSPIAASSGGYVTLADDLYFNGNTVFLDHGQGLITMYCHMSEIKVVEGQKVAQGDILGLVGATGRVTGPHLHWSVSLNGSRVDPQSFTQVLNGIVRPDN